MAPFEGFTGNLNKGTSKSFRGFTGGTEKFKEREKARSQYFDNRPDISKDRLDRRIAQAQELEDFKDTLKIAEGTTNLYQASKPVFDTDSSSPTFGKYVTKTLADKEIELAKKYGPTFSEIAGDMGYAVGSMAKGASEKGVGLVAILKGLSDKFSNDANKNYNNLNDVSKEIADNPNKYPLTSEGLSSLQAMNNNERLAFEAQRDAQKFSFAGDASGVLGVDMNKLDGFVNEPIDTFGTAGPTVDMRSPTKEQLDPLDIDYVESGQFKSDLQKSGIITVDNPSTQEPFSDSTKIPNTDNTIGDLRKALKNQGFDELQIESAINQVAQQIISGEYTGDFEVDTGSTTRGSELSDPNAPGGKAQRELGLLDVINPFDGIPTGMALGEYINPEMYDIQKFKDTLPKGSTIPEMVDTVVGGDDQASITKYNNPFNLEFVGQEGAEPGYGGESGQRFASFDTLDRGLKTGINRVAEIVGDGRTTEGFLDIYAPREDNLKSYDNYLASLEKKVGPTIEPNEIKDLTKGVIRFENTRDIADQYLDYLQRENDRIYSGIIS